MKILVTGSEGFIGQHLTAELVAHGHQVAGVDLQPAHGSGAFIQTDLTKTGEIENALQVFNPERVIHLAAQVGRIFGEQDLRHTIRSNVEMTTVLAQACATRGVQVLYASSSEVYGDQGGLVCTENTPCVLPHNAYGLSKRQGEEFLRLYAPACLQIVRLSMPYGPGAPPGVGRRALDNILWQAIHGKRIPIHRGAERSWCWIGDVVRGIRMVLEGGELGLTSNDPAGRGVYNIGRDNRAVSMETLAYWCCELVGAPPEALIDIVEPPAAQTVVKRLSTHKLQALGWKPEVEMEEGLPKMHDWIKWFDADGDRIKIPPA